MTRDEANYIAEPFIGLPLSEDPDQFLSDYIAEQLQDGVSVILTPEEVAAVAARIRTLTEIAEQNALVSFPEDPDA